MSWTQLGLFLERNLPKKAKPVIKRAKKASKSKPIRIPKPKNYVKLEPGELDDDVNF